MEQTNTAFCFRVEFFPEGISVANLSLKQRKLGGGWQQVIVTISSCSGWGVGNMGIEISKGGPKLAARLACPYLQIL